jgi:hypothetical protein
MRLGEFEQFAARLLEIATAPTPATQATQHTGHEEARQPATARNTALSPQPDASNRSQPRGACGITLFVSGSLDSPGRETNPHDHVP